MATTTTERGTPAPPVPPASAVIPWSPVDLLPAALVLGLGALLLLPGHALWFDELFTAEVVRLPVGEILGAVTSGQGTASYLAGVPPSYNAPYYLVMAVLTSLPGLGGDMSLRLLSLLATAGGLTLISRGVTRLAGRATGVLTGLVLACSPLVLEQAVEARSYGFAVLATGGAFLGLVRYLQDSPRGLLLFGLAGAGMGLMHWYAVTVLAAFVVAAVVLRGRRAWPVVLTAAAAVLPTLLVVGTNLLNGTGSRNAEHLRDTGGTLAERAVAAWTGGLTATLFLTVGLAVVGGLSARGVRVAGTAWVLVPLLLLLAAELARPVYLPRYLLAGLLGLGVLAAGGAMALPRPARVPVAVLLLGCTLLSSAPVLDRGPRERGDEVALRLAEVHRADEPIVAADQRSAIALDHYVRMSAPQLRPSVVLPPDDAPSDADRVWVVRRLLGGEPEPTDDDAILGEAGLRMVRQEEFPADKTHLVLQLWERAPSP